MVSKGLFTSNSIYWETPQGFFDKLNAEFGFTLDVCASQHDAKCARYYSEQDNGLEQPWLGICWMNPPYGREIGKWVRKAFVEARNGVTVVCLLPAKTDTAWWHDYVMKADEIRFVRGRLRFSGSKDNAPFPSAVVVFRLGTGRLSISTMDNCSVSDVVKRDE